MHGAAMMSLPKLYNANGLPIFQNRTFDSKSEATNCATGDVTLVQDPCTGLIFNQSFLPELMIYDANYHNEQGLSSAFRSHLDNVASVVKTHFAGFSLIEVGCGKGHFLEQLQTLGFAITGSDPAYEGANPAILKEYFSPGTGIQADGIILRHVLEHVKDPVGFLAGIRDANGGKGKIYIEVPCFEWICARRAWFDIFYEHVNYFRLSDFNRIFGTVYESGHTFSGQYLYAVADLASLRSPPYEETVPFEFPANFLASVERYAARLGERRTGPSAIWGAASKGVIFALFMARAGVKIDFAVDINPAKQNRFLPVTGLQVLPPEAALNALAPGAEIFVMNGNYTEEIRTLTQARFNYISVDHETL
jgi:hypothetical protein